MLGEVIKLLATGRYVIQSKSMVLEYNTGEKLHYYYRSHARRVGVWRWEAGVMGDATSGRSDPNVHPPF